MTDPVNHPAHYTEHPSGIECIQITEHMGFNLGNAVKYIWRADLKGAAIEDLEKARWYINRELTKRDALFPATEPAEVNGNLSEIPNSSPAPAEPAEEETKAETADAMQRRFIAEIRSMNPDAVMSKRLDDLEAELNASSPVVPAPNETGPWQTWQEVPVGVRYTSRKTPYYVWVNGEGTRYLKMVTYLPSAPWKKSEADDQTMQGRAPFVAAEEG